MEFQHIPDHVVGRFPAAGDGLAFVLVLLMAAWTNEGFRYADGAAIPGIPLVVVSLTALRALVAGPGLDGFCLNGFGDHCSLLISQHQEFLARHQKTRMPFLRSFRARLALM
jgi:hypothetical protein